MNDFDDFNKVNAGVPGIRNLPQPEALREDALVSKEVILKEYDNKGNLIREEIKYYQYK